MINQSIQGIILAAGRSSRFNTSTTKLSFTICGQEMITYPIKILSDFNIPTTLIVGYQKEILFNISKKNNLLVDFIEQIEQKGTGHALMCSKDTWHADNILVMNGDMPLVTKDIIETLISQHTKLNNSITFVTAHNPDPSIFGYGRVITDNNKIRIVEARDFTESPEKHCCLNAGIYIINRNFLLQSLDKLRINENSGEFYITDLIKIASDNNFNTTTVSAPFDSIRGINTLKELWIAEHIKKSQIIDYWMANGVRFMGPTNTSIDANVIIGPESTIGSSVQLKNGTVIGKNCYIDTGSIINNSTIQDYVTIHPYSVINDSLVNPHTQVGPFAHIRNHSTIGTSSYIGNFIEINKSTIGNKTKAKHQAYIGNSIIGSNVNIGAGTVTANYNGFSKFTTTIKDNAFIGVNSSLVAPVSIGYGSLIGAGSIITKDVPEDSLALSRQPQINKLHYASKLKEKYKALKENKNANSSILEDRTISKPIMGSSLCSNTEKGTPNILYNSETEEQVHQRSNTKINSSEAL